jgi:16S rRNA (cytosine967-C5)-methyltransferase
MSARPKSPPTARELAWNILRRWDPQGTYAEEMIDAAARQHFLQTPDRALLNALVLGVLRHQRVLDLWIADLRPAGRLEAKYRRLLHLGLLQLFVLAMPEHAAVHETVNLADKARGLINAILREALRWREKLLALAESAPPNVRFSQPDFLWQRWLAQFGKTGAEKLLAWINTPAPVLLRANLLKFRALAKLQKEPGLTVFPEWPDFFNAEHLPNRLLEEGVAYAQDPSTTLAPRLLDPKPGESVLDACAAPGGKAALLAQMMQNRGQIVCVDSSVKRSQRLAGNLKRLGVSIAEIVTQDWLASDLAPEVHSSKPRGYDAVLVDAPCSNTGVMRRRVDVRWRLTPETFIQQQALQLSILQRLAPLVRSGGRIVYSTCSMEPEENEGVAQKFAASQPGFQIKETRRTLPQRDGVDGSFAALLVKT